MRKLFFGLLLVVCVAIVWMYHGKVGGISRSAGNSSYPCVAIDKAGNPVVAWYEETRREFQVRLRRWDGNAWRRVGGVEGPPQKFRCGSRLPPPRVIIDGEGNPLVGMSNTLEVHVWRWDGKAWAEMRGDYTPYGGMSNTGGSSCHLCMAIDRTANPVVAWVDDDRDGEHYEIYVRRWNGLDWVEMGAGSAKDGGISNTTGQSFHPCMVVNAAGNPIVGWEDNGSGNYEIYVRRWDGKAWVEMGTGSATGGGISGTQWKSLAPSMTVDRTGNPIVAWADSPDGMRLDYGNEIYVRQWDGKTWVEIGAGSASGGGISNTGRTSRCPSIAIAGDGNPVVAWQESVNGNGEIFVRRWDGKSWVEMGKGSASEGR